MMLFGIEVLSTCSSSLIVLIVESDINWTAAFWMLALLVPELRVLEALSIRKVPAGSTTRFARLEWFKIDYCFVLGY